MTCQSVFTESIDQPIAHGLDLGTHGTCYRFRLYVIDASAHKVVKILTPVEGLYQALVLGEVSHDAHLDLGVVRGQESLVAFTGNECTPQPHPTIRLNGDVLQVWVLATETAR